MTKVPFFQTLAARMLLFGVIPTILVIGLIVTLGALDEYRDLRRVEEQVLHTSALGTATALSMRNERWDNVAGLISITQQEQMFGHRAETLSFIRSLVSAFSGIRGAYVVYEPNADGKDAESLRSGVVPKEAMDANGRFLPYWFVPDGAIGAARVATLAPNTGMETLEYYQGPKAAFAKTGVPAPFLTEPYVYDGVLMVSHTYPIVIDGKFAGISGVDRTLDTIGAVADELKAQLGADVFILSGNGTFIASTVDAESTGVTLRTLHDSRYAALESEWRSRDGGRSVFEALDPVLEERCFYAIAPVEVGGWTVVTRRTTADVMASANAAVKRNVLFGLIGIAIVATLMYFVMRTITERVGCAAEVSDRISRGDLTEPVEVCDSRDETGILIRSMDAMDKNLNGLIGAVKQASIRLNSTATEISATAKQQEASASTFGAASSQIAAAVKEISATGKDLMRTVESVSENAAGTAELAGKGKAGLQGMESVMRDLDRATTSIAEKLGSINERSQKITTVITTITKVADQTNILSINAAIEAEKAGEFGSGFLVIAREIRRLADQTASATLDIEQMVQQMQAAVSAGVMEMDRFSDQVRRGVRDVASAGSQLTEIIDRVNRSTESFEQVNESMQSQSEGVQQISDAMASLAGNANQTMQSVQEFGRASADLQSAIGVLRQAVAQFKLKE